MDRKFQNRTTGQAEDVNLRNQAGWERVAKAYAGDEIAEDDPALREFVRDHFWKRLTGRRVLEIGCGPGTDAAKLAARGLDVTATDYSEAFVSIVLQRYPEMEVRRMDMTAPDLPENSFDGVYGFASFIHLPRSLADHTLSQLGELLVPGGLLCLQLIQSTRGITEYSIDSWAGDPQCSMLFTCYDESEIQSRLSAAGFEGVECIPLPPSPVYDGIPRLVERGIKGYLVCARRSITPRTC